MKDVIEIDGNKYKLIPDLVPIVSDINDKYIRTTRVNVNGHNVMQIINMLDDIGIVIDGNIIDIDIISIN